MKSLKVLKLAGKRGLIGAAFTFAFYATLTVLTETLL